MQAAASSEDSPPEYPPGTPGTSAIRLELKDLDGIWKLSFAQFGWQEYDGRGAIVRIENGQMFGGGSNFVYKGHCALLAGAVEIHIEVDRYRADPNFTGSTGLQADHYSVRCIADAITADNFQGRISNEVRTTGGELQEITLAMIRFPAL